MRPTRLLILPLLLAGAASCSRPTARPLNLVLISIDSLRADHLGCYGYERETSPRLDRLAAEGARFSTVVAETSWTLPTHATLFTGLSSRVHGVQTDRRRLPERLVTLAEILKRRGYRTHGVWSGPYLHSYFGLDQGFAPGDWVGVLGRLSYDENPSSTEEAVKARERDVATSISAVTSPEVVARAEAFLDTRNAERPFFLFLHFFDVHYDYVPPEEDWRRFDPDWSGDPYFRQLPFNDKVRADMPDRERAHLLALYDGEIRFTDRWIGRLLDVLEEKGLAEDTVVAVVSDHGDEFFEHGGKGHQNHLYDELLLVPWIVRFPGRVPPGLVLDGQARHLDVMPTLLGLLGVDPPAGVMGRDLSAVVRGEARMPVLPAVSRLRDHRAGTWAALRLPDAKAVRHSGPEGRRAFCFDLSQDPGERRPIPLQDAAGNAGEVGCRDLFDRLASIGAKEERLRRLLGAFEEGGDLPEAVRRELESLGYLR